MTTENIEIANVEAESDEIQKQIEDLKNKLKSVKKAERIAERIAKKAEDKEKEPPKKEKKEPVDKKEYMRLYMRRYKQKNMVQECNRRNSQYYIKKFNIPQDFEDEFGTSTCRAWKAIEAMKHIKKDFPDMYPKLFKYI